MQIEDVWLIGCIVNTILVIGFIIYLIIKKKKIDALPIWFYFIICPLFIALSISSWIMFLSVKFWDKFGA